MKNLTEFSLLTFLVISKQNRLIATVFSRVWKFQTKHENKTIQNFLPTVVDSHSVRISLTQFKRNIVNVFFKLSSSKAEY